MRLQCSVRTPRAKVSELVRNCHVSSRIKKTLLLHEELIADIETKIQAENTSTRMSHSSFCRLRPFWVVHPYMSDRETWMCKLQKKLCQLKLTETSDLDSPTGMVHCDTSSKDCMYGESVKSVGTKLVSMVLKSRPTLWIFSPAGYTPYRGFCVSVGTKNRPASAQYLHPSTKVQQLYGNT